MKKITSAEELRDAIETLEQKKALQLLALEQQFSDIYENLTPANIIRNTLHNAFSSGAKNNIIGSIIGLGTGLLSKKLLVGKSVNIIRKIIGVAVEFGVAGLIAKNADKIKNKGSELIQKAFPKKNNYLDIESSN